MGVWNKEREVDGASLAALQAEIDADPMVARFRLGFGADGDPWTRDRAGKVRNPQQLSDYVRSRYRLPPGYGVSLDGRIVYTNETPILRQLAIGSLPVTGLMGAQALGGLFGGGAAATGQGAALLGPGNAAINSAINAGMASTAGAAAAGGSIADRVARLLGQRGGGVAQAALSALPALALLRGSGGGPFGGGGGGIEGIADELRQNAARQRQRFDEATPAFRTAQNIALGMAPTQYRSNGGPF